MFSQPDEQLLSEQLGPMKLVHIFGAKRGCEWVGFEPNCVGSLKADMVQPSNVVTVILPLASLVKFIVDSGSSCTSFFEFKEFLKCITQEQADSMAANGVNLHLHTAEYGDMLWIPLGWLVMEKTASMIA